MNLTTKALNRLAAYEDTGLMPEEIVQIKIERDKVIAVINYMAEYIVRFGRADYFFV